MNRAAVRGVAAAAILAILAMLAMLAMLVAALPAAAAPANLALPAAPALPPPPRPAGHEPTAATVALGARLFADPRLSVNGSTACATCHDPARAFTDGRAVSTGALGDALPRNAPTLLNVAWNRQFGWADPSITTLEQQHRGPLLATAPVEMGLTPEVLARFAQALADDPELACLWRAAWPAGTPVTLDRVVLALADFVRTLLAVDAPWDRFFRADDRSAFGAAELRGLRLFLRPDLACAQCHAGPLFGGPAHLPGAGATAVFHNTGAWGTDSAALRADRGAIARTGHPDDHGAFRAPGLRNVALTAPYLHDGSAATLDDVIDLYAAGGRRSAEHGDGIGHPHKRTEVAGFTLTTDERRDLLAFLHALTDPAAARPWRMPVLGACNEE